MGLNISIYVEFLIFAVVFLFLKATFFRPMLRHLHKRDEKTTLFAEQIREIKHKCDHRIKGYKDAKSKIAREHAELMNQYARESSTAYRDIVTQGRSKELSRLNQHREKLSLDYTKLGQELILPLNDVKKSLKQHLC